MVKVGDKITSKQTGLIYTVKDIGDKVIWVNGGGYLSTDDLDKFETPYDELDYQQLYEQQKQQINNLKTEILIINNDAVNSGDEMQMKITGRVIEALENTIVDDWRVGE